MPRAASAEPILEVVGAKSGRTGRPKRPIEQRKARSDRPHRGRKGPPDIPLAESIRPDPVPAKPPIELSKYELDGWNEIAGPQVKLAESQRAWIYRNDCAHLIATVILYGRLMDVRDELNSFRDKNGGYVDEFDKPHPLLKIEADLVVKFQAALRDLGMVPTRRQVVGAPAAKAADPNTAGLLS